MASSSEASNKGGNYSIEDDVAQCRAYIVISEDPIIGNGQVLMKFFKRVVEVFNGCKELKFYINKK